MLISNLANKSFIFCRDHAIINSLRLPLVSYISPFDAIFSMGFTPASPLYHSQNLSNYSDNVFESLFIRFMVSSSPVKIFLLLRCCDPNGEKYEMEFDFWFIKSCFSWPSLARFPIPNSSLVGRLYFFWAKNW